MVKPRQLTVIFRAPHIIKRLLGVLLLLALVLLAASNWFVHQPFIWQMRQLRRLPQNHARQLQFLGNLTADITDSLGLTGRDVTAFYEPRLDTNSIAAAGLPSAQTNQSIKTIILQRQGFTVGYAPELRHPLWVAYKVYPHTYTNLPPRPAGFKADPQAAASPHHRDYTHSGYDRGHMAPNLAIASRHGREAQLETFLTSNICPQKPGLNRGPWRELEYRLSEVWPHYYGTIWIVVGVILPNNPQKLESGVNIPKGFYQVVLAQHKNQLRAFGAYMPQNIPFQAYSRTSLISIRQLEQMSGLDFNNALPPSVQEQLELPSATRYWPAGLAGTRKIINDRYYIYHRSKWQQRKEWLLSPARWQKIKDFLKLPASDPAPATATLIVPPRPQPFFYCPPEQQRNARPVA